MTKGKVLVVDDDRLVLATVAHGLSQAGYQVIDADNGDDAILLARQHKPDLALLDIRMEGKSGFDVAAYLRDYCQIPFMFLSAFVDEETLQQVHALGALTYLTKPLDVQQIIPEVDDAFKRIRGVTTPTTAAQEPSPTKATTPAPTTAPTPSKVTSPKITPVYMIAVGIVMHRHSLSRADAMSRLEKQAQQQSTDLQALCQRIIDVQEVLSGTDPR
jgi:two-component system, response regulator PdtaR